MAIAGEGRFFFSLLFLCFLGLAWLDWSRWMGIGSFIYFFSFVFFLRNCNIHMNYALHLHISRD